MITGADKIKIEATIVELGGPFSTIEYLIETIQDKEILEEKIKFVLSIRHLSKKTVIGNETIEEYFSRLGLRIYN